MLTQLIFLALSATALARPQRLELIGAQEPILSDLCPSDLRHFLLPHEYDCTKFYYCEYGMKWETPRDCALGTHFSFELQVCVHPIQAGCTLPGVPTEEPETEAPETEAPETEAPETEATTSAPSSTIAGIVSSPHTTEAPETEATTSASSSITAGIISSPHTTEAPETEATTSASSSITAGIVSSPHTTEAPETEATTSASSSITAGIVSSPHTTEASETEAPETEATTSASSSITAGIVSSPHTTEAPETEATTSASSSITAGIVSSPHTTEAPETEATTSASSSITAGIVSSPHTTEAPETEATTSAVSSTIAGIVSSPHTTATPETEATTSAPSSTEAAIISTTAAPSSTEASIISSPHTTEATDAPTTVSPGGAPEGTEWLENGCPVSWDLHWLLPHEECNKFYYCNFGEKVERTCPPSTYFNPVLQVCDHAWNVECAGAGSEDNGTDEEDGGNEEDSEDDGEGQWLDNGCPADWNVHWLLPHETDCGKFYYCVHGQKVERECRDPLHFNPTLQVCDWAANAGCSLSGSNEDNNSVDDGGEDNNEENSEEGANNEENSVEDNNTDTGSNEVELLDNGCPADSNIHWLLPHESDCGKFYYCVNGQKVERECRDPLHFNPTLQVCDWAENAGCASGDSNGGEDDGNNGNNSVEDGDDSEEDSNNGGGNGDDNNEENSEEDNAEWLDNGCPADLNVHWLLPHESDCGKFYYCVQGEKVERECSEPLHFNPTLQVCDWAENAGCALGDNNGGEDGDDNEEDSNNSGGNGEEDNNEENSEEDNGEWLDNGCPADLNVHWLLPHESDCGKFYYCVNGQKVERECRDPLHFNPTLQVCDWAENAGCKSSENNGESNSEEDNNNVSGENNSSEDNTDNGGDENNNTSVESTEAEWLDNGCPADWNTHWLLPHESDCSKFYYCVQGSKVERECRDPLHFNPTLQVCDWAENAGCASNGNNGGNSEEDNNNGGNSEEDNTNGGNSEEDSANGGNSEEDNNNGGNSEEDSANEGNSEEDSANGGNSEEDNNNGGNSEEDSANGGNSEEDNAVIAPEEEPDNSKCVSNCNTLPWAHETACDKYWRCEGEKAVLVVCSEGLHFNAKSGTCDFICNANCVRENIQSTADQQGLKIFVPWDKVRKGMRF